ncbi:hypothetical protein N3996_001076 [Salmonella enterica]|nr:hypothetical protein [Salmonella enterica]
MKVERKNCLICGLPDVPVIMLDHENIHCYHCPSCKDYYATRTFVSKMSGLKFNEYLSLMITSSPDDKILCFKHNGVDGIRIHYDDKIKS